MLNFSQISFVTVHVYEGHKTKNFCEYWILNISVRKLFDFINFQCVYGKFIGLLEPIINLNFQLIPQELTVRRHVEKDE